MPVRTFIACHKAGLPVAVGCSILIQETAGGINEFGHDRDSQGDCPGFGWGTVTEAKYLAFRTLRNRQGRSNGVGPCQLTSPGLQNEADAQGGCWKPLINMTVGFTDLAESIRRDGLRAAIVGYNGSGPAAEAYADQVLARADGFAVRLGTAKL